MTVRAAALVLALSAAASAAALDIVRLGRPAAAILVDPAAEPSAGFAAAELKRYVKELTGVELPSVVRPNTAWKTIRIGRPPAATNGVDEIACFVNRSGELELTGEGSRGPVYAVYKFLEKAAGVRYWSPWCEQVPKLKAFSVPKSFELRHVPSFEWRNGWGVSDNGRPSAIDPWKRKIGHNAVFPAATKAAPYEAGLGETMMNLFLRPDRYFADHPEWYAFRDGKRAGTQICASCPEALDRLVEEVRAHLRAHPRTVVLAMASQDNADFCRCRKCEKLLQRHGCGNTALELTVVNEVARRLADEFPSVQFAALAYWTKQTPPAKMKIEPNVAVGLALERNMAAPVHKDAGWRTNAAGWRKAVKGNLYFWDYYANFRNFNEPRPDFVNIAENLRCYRRLGMKGGFAQMRLGELANFGEMLAYLWGQLMWDCDQDEDALIEEYIRGNYGAAAPEILAYWRLQVDSMRKCPKANLGMYHSNYDEWFGAKEMAKAWDLVCTAMEKTKDEWPARRKVEYLYCSVLNDFCLRWGRLDLDHKMSGAKLAHPVAAPWDLFAELDDLRREYSEGYWNERTHWDEAMAKLRAEHDGRKAKYSKPGAVSPYTGRNYRAYTPRQVVPRSKSQQW